MKLQQNRAIADSLKELERQIGFLCSNINKDLNLLINEATNPINMNHNLRDSSIWKIQQCGSCVKELSNKSKLLSVSYNRAISSLLDEDRRIANQMFGANLHRIHNHNNTPYHNSRINPYRYTIEKIWNTFKFDNYQRIKDKAYQFWQENPTADLWDTEFVSGDKIVNVSTTVKYIADKSKRISQDIDIPGIIKGQLDSLESVILNFDNGELNLSEDGVEFKFDIPNIIDKYGDEVYTTGGIIISMGLLSDYKGVTISSEKDGVQVETKITLEELRRRWKYDSIDVSPEYSKNLAVIVVALAVLLAIPSNGASLAII